MLHYEPLLASDTICHSFIEQFKKYMLLRRVQAGQDRDVMLALGAKAGTCSDVIDKFPTVKVSEVIRCFQRLFDAFRPALRMLAFLNVIGGCTYCVMMRCLPFGSRYPLDRARSAYCWPVRAYLEASSGVM